MGFWDALLGRAGKKKKFDANETFSSGTLINFGAEGASSTPPDPEKATGDYLYSTGPGSGEGKEGKPSEPDDALQERLNQLPIEAAPGVDSAFGWDVVRIREALRQHASGRFGLSGLLKTDVLHNPIIGHAVEVRQEAFTTLPQNFTPGNKSKEAKRARDFIREAWPDICPPSLYNELWEDLRFMGDSVSAIEWELRTDGADRWWLPRIKPWHPTHLEVQYRPDLPNSLHTSVDGHAMLAITRDKGLVAVQPGFGRWLHFKLSPRQSWTKGLLANLAISFLGDEYTLEDTLALQETFGQGFWKLFHPAGWSNRQVEASKLSVYRAGRRGVIGLPMDMKGVKLADLDLVRADSTGQQIFESTEKRLLRRFLIVLLGQDGTTVQGSGPYTQMAALTNVLWHKREKDAAAFGDARLTVKTNQHGIGEKRWIPHNGTFRSQLTKWIAYFNFGAFEHAPYIWFDATPPEDRLARERVMLDAAGKRGRAVSALGRGLDELIAMAKAANPPVEVDIEWIAEQCGLSLTRPPEEKLLATGVPLMPYSEERSFDQALEDLDSLANFLGEAKTRGFDLDPAATARQFGFTLTRKAA
jgi:hypothetical protein